MATPMVWGPAGILSRGLPRGASRPMQAHPLTVQRDLDLLVGADRLPARKPAAGAADSELVLGVERKDVLHHQAAARAERQSLRDGRPATSREARE